MSATAAAGDRAFVVHDDAVLARTHTVFRFATGVTLAFVACEWLGWAPTFLGPVLAAVLLANLPIRPPLKMAIGLIVTMAVAAGFAYGLSALLRGTPVVLFGFVMLLLFLAFTAVANDRARVPAMLLLICLAVIPTLVLVAPAYAGIMPRALVQAVALALAVIALVHVPWPRRQPHAPPPAAGARAIPTFELAVMSTLVVAPVMLVFLLFGLADALPVLTTVVLLVATFDLARSRMTAIAMVFGNLAGGALGLLMHSILLTAPSLPFLALLLFVVTLAFGRRVAAGGPMAAVAVVTCNQMLIVLSLAIAEGQGSMSVWLTRLFQFALATTFAVAVLTYAFHRATPRRAPSPQARPGDSA